MYEQTEVDFCNDMRKMMRERIVENNMLLNEYRCVRNSLYPRHTDPSQMEGYYIRAYYLNDALDIMDKRFPGDNESFSAELWKEDLDQKFWKETTE